MTSTLGHDHNGWLSHVISFGNVSHWNYCPWVREICFFPGAFTVGNPTDALCQYSSSNSSSLPTITKFKQKCLIMLLLLLSGIQPNPGPLMACHTPTDFKNLSGLHIIHVNARSLLPKMDMLRIWSESTGADLFIVSETWLSKKILDKDVGIYGFNIYRSDRPRKGGGVAICVKHNLAARVIFSKSAVKQFEILALKIDLSGGQFLTVVGCYRQGCT